MPAGQYDNLLKRYAVYAPIYDRLFARYNDATLQRALEAIPLEGESSLIDVACGTGLLAERLRQQRPELRITGIDLSPAMLEKARQRIPLQPGVMEWRIGQAEKLPVESSRFDVLTCTNAFHLVQDAPAALMEFRRVLKPQGALVLVDWCLDFALMKFRNAVFRIVDHQKRQIRRMNDLAALMEDAGFSIEHKERFCAGTWGLMCVVARSPEAPSVLDLPNAARKSMARS